jgi:UDP-galactopyranose mutase
MTDNFTRIVEYKHFLDQKSPHTIIVFEHSKDGGEPYYVSLRFI